MSGNKTVLIGVGRGGCNILAKVKTNLPKLFIDTDKDVEVKFIKVCQLSLTKLPEPDGMERNFSVCFSRSLARTRLC